MSCDGTEYGYEADNPDWTEAELDLLDAELVAARKKAILEAAKQVGESTDTVEGWLKNYPNDRTVKSIALNIATSQQAVYQAAHDRHYLDMHKRNLGKLKVAAKHGHAHGATE